MSMNIIVYAVVPDGEPVSLGDVLQPHDPDHKAASRIEVEDEPCMQIDLKELPEGVRFLQIRCLV